MFENPRRGRRARNFTTNVPKILVLKSSSEQIFSRKLPLGAPVVCVLYVGFLLTVYFTIAANDIIIIIPYCISKRRTHININSKREKTALRERHGLCLAALKH